MCTQMSPQNSQRICRQAPQGAAGRGESATTAMASNSRSPSETALKTATRSAQMREPVGGVLDVAAGDDLARARAQGGARP